MLRSNVVTGQYTAALAGKLRSLVKPWQTSSLAYSAQQPASIPCLKTTDVKVFGDAETHSLASIGPMFVVSINCLSG